MRAIAAVPLQARHGVTAMAMRAMESLQWPWSHCSGHGVTAVAMRAFYSVINADNASHTIAAARRSCLCSPTGSLPRQTESA
jgi:hypothetical protein